MTPGSRQDRAFRTCRIAILSLLLAGLTAAVPGTLLAGEGEWVRKRRDLSIPMRDGKGLAADVHFPPREGKYPAILVSSSNHPRFELNPHTGDDHWDEEKALDLRVTIHHGRKHPSTVTLPVRKE